MDFHFGFVDLHNRSYSYYVRCVRGEQSSSGVFVDNGDHTVTDITTGLMWQQDEGGYMDWEEAITYCEDLSLAGYTDWRLPNIKDLESITDDSFYDPAIATNYFPDARRQHYYWSSTTSASSSSSAWVVGCGIGSVGRHNNSYTNCVRCVRGGQ